MALSAPPDRAARLSPEWLTPTEYLDRAAEAHGGRIGALNGRPAAVPATTTHLLLEASVGVPWAGGLPTRRGPRTGADANRENVEYR